MEPFPAKIAWILSNTKRARMRSVLRDEAVRGCDPLNTKVMAAPNEVLVIITPRRALGQYFEVTARDLVHWGSVYWDPEHVKRAPKDEGYQMLFLREKLPGLTQAKVFTTIDLRSGF